MSARGDHMAASQERAPRGADPRDVSLVSISACSGVNGVVVLNTVTDDGFAGRRADDLDAEAGCWDPVVRVEVDGQLIVSAAQVLDERMSFTDHLP